MSELKLEDIISREALEGPLILASNLEKAEKVLMRIRNSSEKVVADSETTTSMKKLTDSVSKLVTENKELEKVEKQLATAQAKNSDEYAKIKRKVDEVNQAVKSKVALGEKDSLAINKTNSSLKELQAALTKNRQAYASLRSEQERNSKEGQNLLKVIQQQDSEFKELSATIGQHQPKVGDYEGAITGLKQELKAARDEMVGIAKTLGTESPEFIAAAKKAGALKDQINDINDSVKNTEASGLENIANSFGDIGTKLKAGDFGGAANSARQFADALKGMSFKELKDQLGGFVSALGTMGKAILTNPIFIIAGVVAAAVAAFQYFNSVAEEMTKTMIERSKKEMNALTERYDHEIKLMSIAGKNTFEIEKQKQKAIIDNADLAIKKAQQAWEVDLKLSLLTRTLIYKKSSDQKRLTDEEKAQIAELQKIKEDANRQLEIINAEEVAFTKQTQEDIFKAKKDGILKLNEFRLQRQIDQAKEEISNDKLTFDQRADAALRLLTLEDEAAKMKRDNDLKQEGLTNEGRILIREKYFSESLEAEKNYAKNISALGEQVDNQTRERLKAEFEARMRAKQAELDAGIKAIQDEVIMGKKLRSEGDKEIAALRKQFADDLVQEQINALQKLLQYEEFNSEERAEIEKRLAELKVELSNAVYDQVSDNNKLAVKSEEEKLQEIINLYTNFSSSIAGIFDGVTQRRIQNIDSEIEKLNEETETKIRNAGDNDAAVAAIEANAEVRREQLEKRKTEAMRKQAILEKSLSLVRLAIQTAIDIAKIKSALAAANTAALVYGPLLSPPIIAANSAAAATQIALAYLGSSLAAAAIAAQPIPQFAVGTDNAPEGLAIVGEKGPELKISPSGQTTLTPGKPTLDYLEAGTKIIPHDETMRMLALSAFGNQALIHREQLEKINLAHAIDASSDKIVKGLSKAIKANKPGNLVKQGRLIYEQLKKENGNTQFIRRSNLGY